MSNPQPYSEEWWMRHDVRFYLRRCSPKYRRLESTTKRDKDE